VAVAEDSKVMQRADSVFPIALYEPRKSLTLRLAS